MTGYALARSFSPLRARYDDAADRSPAPHPQAPSPGAGEPVLSQGQKIALLNRRKSDWSKAVLAKLTELGAAAAVKADYDALAAMGLAINKGGFHVLTPGGRWRADQVAMEIARSLDMHVITYDYGGFDRAPFWHCTCGERSCHSRRAGNFIGILAKGGKLHLEHVGAVAKRDVA